MVKKIPMRTCVESREVLPKKELIRIVRSSDNIVSVDLKGKANGRGAYLKRDLQIIAKAKKSRSLDRKLECSVPEEIYDELNKLLS